MNHKFSSDVVLDLTDNQSFDVNLGFLQLDDESPSDVKIRVSDREYNGIPVRPDLFPIALGDDFYNAHLVYSTYDITLYVIKNGEKWNQENDGYVSLDVTNLNCERGDVVALYLIGLLRDESKDLSQ